MGWKNFKTQFKIKHNVQITNKGLCIGSGYVHDLVVINLTTGQVKENSTFSGFLKEHYPELLKASSENILAALNSPDYFKTHIPVYSYQDSTIIEEHAEEFGYPHTTHQGNLMYENTHFKTKTEAIYAARQNNQAAISLTQDMINEYQNKLSEMQKNLADLKLAEKKLAES